jgi:signal transduction histidine kinase
MTVPVLSIRVSREQDLVIVRQRTRQLASLLGFEPQDQTRIATAVSEICRNAYGYAGGGRIEFVVEANASPQVLVIRVIDRGPGIPDVDAILQGRYQSRTGMGLGLQGARRLVDEFRIDSEVGKGTVVTMRKHFPKRAPLFTASGLQKLGNELAILPSEDLYQELQTQNQELLKALSDIRMRQEELGRLNSELEDTNRGVVALYAELDEKAEHLKTANQLKSTFLSHMSHEFRTPLNSVMALSGILLERLDGPLTGEQEKQVRFILKAAQELTDMVNDLLDLAKVEAGKIEVHPTEWYVSTLFGTLRGMLRPLLFQQQVQLLMEYSQDFRLYTDEVKVSQILRNFISNAIKFTEQGEIRVTAEPSDRGSVRFSVSDTGIGIEPENQEHIFQQFTQVDNPRQRKVKGTGLGLPLSRKLAELLGGRIELRSEPGVGSTFSVIVPARYVQPGAEKPEQLVMEAAARPGETRLPAVLVIDDDDMARYLVGRQLAMLPLAIIEESSATAGLKRARDERPIAIVLDLMMPEVSGFETLEELQSDTRTRDIPVVIHTSMTLSDRDRGLLESRAAAVLNKNAVAAGALRSAVEAIVKALPARALRPDVIV